MIRKSGNRFSLATNAIGVCAEITLKQEDEALPCDYQNLGFACDGAGYLRLGEQIMKEWPCPKCNTAAFLEKSFRAAKDRLPKDVVCPCCGPGLSYDEVWSSAMKVARECNPEATTVALLGLSRPHQGQFKAE
jgi:hypothetical protein